MCRIKPADPHFLSASQLVVSHIFETLKATAEKAVSFEIVLSDPAGIVLVANASEPSTACFPVGAKLGRHFLDHNEACMVKSFSLNERQFSYTIVPIADGQSQFASGYLLILIGRDLPIEVSTVKTWVDLILSRARLDCSVEKALTHNEQMMQIFNTMQEGCMATDSAGVVTFINQAGADIFGMQAADIVGSRAAIYT